MRMTPLVFLLFLFFPASVLAQGYDDKSPKQPTPKQIEAAGPHASIIFAPTGARAPADLPRDKMIEALSEISKGDPKEAGHELKKAVDALQAAADTSVADSIRSNMLRSVVELSSKAERMRSGEAVTANDLTPMFSRGMQALAVHHAALAEKHFQNGDNYLAGEDLRASVLDANQAMVWGNVKATTDDTGRINVASLTAKNMMDLKTVDKVSTAKLIADVGTWAHDLKTRVPKAGV
jgi:hypothetical protein